MAKKQTYGNDSIKSLKGADRVRLRPGVIFGSDGIDGCQIGKRRVGKECRSRWSPYH